MKTTSGKTKAARPAARSIRIYVKNGSSWRIIAVKKCSTLKQALTEYYKDTLAPRGDSDPDYKGNMLTVTNRSGRDSVYVALELTQSPEDDRH